MSIHNKTTEIFSSHPQLERRGDKSIEIVDIRRSLAEKVVDLDQFLVQVGLEPDLKQYYSLVEKIIKGYKKRKEGSGWEKEYSYLSLDNQELCRALGNALQEYDSKKGVLRLQEEGRAKTDRHLQQRAGREEEVKNGKRKKLFPYGGAKAGTFDIRQNPPQQI